MSKILGEYARNDRVYLEESHVIMSLMPPEGILIDVGAENGYVTRIYSELNWQAYSFEPDPDNYKGLLKTASRFDKVECYNYAISDVSSKNVSFYASEESKFVNSLHPFTKGHSLKTIVDTKTLAEFIKEKDITHIDFLKVDTEGHGFFVLKGMDWESVRPSAIVCEFEDRKTLGLGYTASDMADYLVEKGYTVYVSQWHPLERYGQGGSFMCLKSYPCEIDSESNGNFIAFKDYISFEEVENVFLKHIGYRPDDKKRLFLIAGPTQALNAMSIIKEDGNKHNHRPIRDFALIGGLAVDYKQNGEIIEATKRILEKHDWAQIIDITPYENEIGTLFTSRNYTQCEKAVFHATGVGVADELYMFTNAKTPLTIMMGRAYEKHAKITVYGDGFGIIDSAIGYGFSRIDEVRAFLPIEYHKGFLRHTPLRIMQKETLLQVIDDTITHDAGLDAALSALAGQVDETSVLLTTVQFAEWSMMDLANEVSMYVKAVVRNAEPGCKVFIKEHPRVLLKKRIALLTKILEQKGYKCIHINDEALRFAPVEVICRRIKFKKLISTASTSGLYAKYLYDYPIDLGIDDMDIQHFRRGDYLKIFINGLTKSLENLETWDGLSPVYSLDTPPHNYFESGEDFKSKNPMPTNEHVNSWLETEFYEKGIRLCDLFKKKSLRSVAVYGIGVIGRRIVHDLSMDNELELYLLDSALAGGQYLSKDVYSLEQFDKTVDAVLIAITRDLVVSEVLMEIESSNIKTNRILTLNDLIRDFTPQPSDC